MGILVGIGNTNPTFSYDCFYGVEFDTTVASYNGTRVGRADLHANVPIQSKMRRCVLKDDGTVAYYLHANDSTKRDTGAAAVLDGTDGQVMVEIPAHYRRFETEGTKIRCLLSEYPLPGFTLVPKMYVSAYEATVDRTSNKLASVVNTTAQYRGGGNNASRDAGENTDLGKPATAISLTNYRTYARNRGNEGEAFWNCYTYEAHKALTWLFAVEYATRHSQATFSEALDDNGYHIGGLGPGVSTVNSTDWNTFNGYYPIVPCGVTNSLGNKTGVVEYALPASFGDGNVKVSVPSYRGVENPFGHLFKWTDGALFAIQSANDGGKSLIYVCDNPAGYGSSISDQYKNIGEMARTEGYVKNVVFGEGGDIFPLEVGGGSTTYWCDFFNTSIPESGVSTRGLMLGGSAHCGANCGFAYVYSTLTPSYTYANIGSRLCYICEAA